MKKQFFILAAFILLNASFALAEWSGDTLKPEYKNGIGYVISKPEELVWVGRYGDTDYRLVNDIIFGKDKNTVNREHPLKSLWLQQGVGLYFNGFSVYGAYSEGEPFIVCSSNYKYPIAKPSFKNFEINVTEKSPSMIEAFNLFSQKNKEWKLDIVGEGTEEKTFRALISKYQLEDRITIHPFTNHIQEYYSEAQVYVLSSRW